jgi:hypothetical protein
MEHLLASRNKINNSYSSEVVEEFKEEASDYGDENESTGSMYDSGLFESYDDAFSSILQFDEYAASILQAYA